MTGLIILLILIPIVFLFLLIAILNKTTSQQNVIESLNNRLGHLIDQIADLEKTLKEKVEKPLAKTGVDKMQNEKASHQIPLPEEKKPAEKPSYVAATEEATEFIYKKAILPETTNSSETKSWWTKWLEKNPDMERFIGENLANKIGITVLVLGITFFVKYAIDKDWINETGRVIIGLFCGTLLIGVAHKLRNSYRSFSSVLVGGGITVFYFTIAFAFHQYQLITLQTAFISMSVITVSAVILSVFYDRLELAILATIGGFITPFLVSTGSDNYTALFTYLAILNTGLIILSWFKRWPSINTIALFFTLIIFAGWLGKRIWFNEGINFPHKDALFFASLFYLQFLVMNITNNFRKKQAFTGFDFITVLSVNFLYYAAGLVILQNENYNTYKGLFTGSLAVINLVLVLLFFKSKRADRNFIMLLLGLVFAFVSLIAPVQFKGNAITLFWVAESVILFWMFQRTKINLMKIVSLIVLVLSIGSLVINWSDVYFSETTIIPILINKGFVTTAFTSLVVFIFYSMVKNEEPDKLLFGNFKNSDFKTLLLSGGLIIAYLAGVLEIYYQFNTRIPTIPIYAIYLQLYSFSVAIFLLWLFRKSESYWTKRLTFTILGFVLYILNLGNNSEVSFAMVQSGNIKFHFIAHGIASLFLLKLLVDLIILSRKEKSAWSEYQNVFTWLSAIAIIFLLSIEMYHVNLWINYYPKTDWGYWENLYYKAGLTILWSISSFIMMWLGMKYRFRTLRIISLSLFTIILLKLFLYDLTNIPPGGKIAAFVMLGILLLTVSFMYQRLKKIIIEEVSETNEKKSK